MNIRGLVLGAAVMALTISSASATMWISEDRGGQIGRYLQAYAAVRSSGENVVVDGSCLSACTLRLPRCLDARPRRPSCNESTGHAGALEYLSGVGPALDQAARRFVAKDDLSARARLEWNRRQL